MYIFLETKYEELSAINTLSTKNTHHTNEICSE